MFHLKEIRSRLAANREPDSELSVQLVQVVLNVDEMAAQRWIQTFGPPLRDPVATALLATGAEVDGGVLLNTCIHDLDLCLDTSRPGLARQMARLLLDALVVFGDTQTKSNSVD